MDSDGKLKALKISFVKRILDNNPDKWNKWLTTSTIYMISNSISNVMEMKNQEQSTYLIMMLITSALNCSESKK